MIFSMRSLTNTLLLDNLQPLARKSAYAIETNLHLLADRMMGIAKDSRLLNADTAALLPSACTQQEHPLKDAYYNAQLSDYTYGWKEYIIIMVKGGEIVTVEYNAQNESGFIKSWDNTYMQNMLRVEETYPNAYARCYASQLIGATDVVKIDAISGATSA